MTARRRVSASWCERGRRVTRAFARAAQGALAAVVLALAAFGAWELGGRVAADEGLSAAPAKRDKSAPENDLPAPERGGLPMPVLGADPAKLRDDFGDARGGTGSHDAIDIPAPRNTPVVAVDDGTIAKLFLSERGGLTIYHFDPTESYCYYYAHLESYALDLNEGQRVTRGQVIGYVGTSGNAPEQTPHLHFSVNRLGAEKRWWETTPVNPFPLLRAGRAAVADDAP